MGPLKRRPVRPFEAITTQQNRKLHAVLRQKKITEHRLYEMVTDLIGIPSISALSKQEASFIIRRLEGSTQWLWPRSPKLDVSSPVRRPNLAYIRGIRAIAKDLQWDKTHLKHWLQKYMKTGSIRDLDPESARKAFIGLRQIYRWKKRSNPEPSTPNGGVRR